MVARRSFTGDGKNVVGVHFEEKDVKRKILSMRQ
jgi:hypothetical protein